MRELINQHLNTALKAKDIRRISTLRLVNAAIKDKDIEARGQGKPAASDEEIVAIIQKMVKQREDSFSAYSAGGRMDLATTEKEEIGILSEYLPQLLDAEELDLTIRQTITKLGAAGQKDIGRVISALKIEYPGRIDFSKASALVKAALGA